MKRKFISLIIVVMYMVALIGCAKQHSTDNSNCVSNSQTAENSNFNTISTVTQTSESKTNNTTEENITSKQNTELKISASAELNSSTPNTSSHTKYYDLAEKIFPEDSNYSISRPPYKYGDCRSVKSINEFREFINAPNAETIDEGFYYSFVKLIKQNGYIPELYYKGESLFEDKFRSEIDAWSVENGNVKTLSYIEMHPEKNVTGVGYTIPEVNLKGDTIRFISVYYLREEWLKYAKERPYLFSSGKKNPAFYNQKEIPNYEGILKTIKINGKETVTCKSSEGTFFYYVCDEYLIKIFNPDGMDFYELAKNLSIKKVPLEQ